MANLYRDRDVRNAMRDLAEATGLFDVATTGGLPETQPVAGGVQAMVDIEPLHWHDETPHDGAAGPILLRTATVKVTVLVVAEEPAHRDEEAERLWCALADAWNGVRLGGLTVPDKTMFAETRWLRVKDAERRVESKFMYSYYVGGFRDFGTAE